MPHRREERLMTRLLTRLCFPTVCPLPLVPRLPRGASTACSAKTSFDLFASLCCGEIRGVRSLAECCHRNGRRLRLQGSSHQSSRTSRHTRMPPGIQKRTTFFKIALEPAEIEVRHGDLCNTWYSGVAARAPSVRQPHACSGGAAWQLYIRLEAFGLPSARLAAVIFCLAVLLEHNA